MRYDDWLVDVAESTALPYLARKLDIDFSHVDVLRMGQSQCFWPREYHGSRPSDLTQSGLPDPCVGGLDSKKILARFSAYAKEELASGDVAVAFEDFFPDHPKGEKIPVGESVSAIGTDLFVVAGSQITSNDVMESLVVKFRTAWKFEMLVSPKPNFSKVTQDLLRSLKSIVVDAHDGETFLIWRRQN
ncbi:hypothetical protein ELH51_33605 (plasmid) [Rhizobium ruizarguesonis]|uniref:hypothetical protein n=1 Tax=Rhizobium TaxID=379 RepID=UPI0010308681|nr:MULTISPECIES: hypothetical protein [Rhizobium]MBY2950951.1 hypothetical protein [Rhizobium leguminosarum]TBB15097.1 hypothetical protein ELH51_33605 [Rhizobium ruizarguesonis]